MKHKVILDTDPGIDDAMAIAYAIAHPQVELVGLTTIFGNVTVEEATRNALDLLDHFGCGVDVAPGEPRPLTIAPNRPSYTVHGDNGFGQVALKASRRRALEVSAADYIIEKTRAHPGEITLCAVGPLTNLAVALKRDPTLAERVRQVVVMGGAIDRPGNVSPAAEANFWNDPHAADAVLSARWPLVLAPLDCTMPVVFGPDYFAALAEAAPLMGGVLAEMARFYTRFYRSHVGVDGCVPHDVMALAWLTMPGVYWTRLGSMAVTTEGPALGKVHFNPAGRFSRDAIWQERPRHTALTGTDAHFFRADYFRTLSSFEGSSPTG